MGRRAWWVVAATVVPLLGCRPDTVSLRFEPREGATYRYRYEIEVSVTRTVEGDAPETTEVTTTLTSSQKVIKRTTEGTVVEVTLRSEGTAPRTAIVVLDRAGSLQAIEQIAGLPGAALGLPSTGGLLPSTATVPPEDPLSVGDDWTIADGPLTGEARLDRLGVVDGEDVAVITSDLREVLADVNTVEDSDVVLDGDLLSTTSTTFDLADGAVRRATVRSSGSVAVLVSPPVGVVVAPVEATVTYQLRVRTTRL